MTDDAHLTGKKHKVSDFYTPRYAGHGGDDTAPTKFHVMGNLNKIVYPAPLSNNGIMAAAAINCRVGANLDIVTNDRAAQLRHLRMPL